MWRVDKYADRAFLRSGVRSDVAIIASPNMHTDPILDETDVCILSRRDGAGSAHGRGPRRDRGGYPAGVYILG